MQLMDGIFHKTFLLQKNYKPGYSLFLTPYAAYAINRNALLGSGTLRYNYSPMQRGTGPILGWQKHH